MKWKPAKKSVAMVTEMVLPKHTNRGTLRGGLLLKWMDRIAVKSAEKHAGKTAVTVALDNVSFRHAVKTGDVLMIKAQITRSFRTSMEVRVEVWCENTLLHEHRLTNVAYFTLVAVDEEKFPVPVPAISPESEEEINEYNAALRRREWRLLQEELTKPYEAEGVKRMFA